MNKSRCTKIFILAGGLGTRLSHIVKDTPKPMAPVSGIPFLEWQIKWLEKQNFKNIVILAGYMHEKITGYFKDGSSFGVDISYSIEDDLLGTGGAVIKALRENPCDDFIIINGDTFFNINLKWLFDFYRSSIKSGVCLALKYIDDTRRYGNVEISDDYKVLSLLEKNSQLQDGYINGGIYIGTSDIFYQYEIKKISFETEIFPLLINSNNLYGVPFGDRFIDIGVPEDYYKADSNMKRWFYEEKQRAVFIDRDGVIVEDVQYLSSVNEIKFIPEIYSFLKKVQEKDYMLIVISNQAGVAKRKFTETDLENVNRHIKDTLSEKGIEIRKFYCALFHEDATDLSYKKNSLLRKPEPGMVLKAVEEFNLDGIDAVMVGDKDSDIIKLPYISTYLIKGRYEIINTEKIISFVDLEEKL